MKTDQSFGILPLYRDGDDIKILLIQHIEGHWAFPKGHLEAGETELAAAQREFEEETGIKRFRIIDPHLTIIGQYVFEKDGEMFDKTVKYFPAWVGQKKVTIQEKEVADYGWYSLADAKDRLTFSSAKKVLRQLTKLLKAGELGDQ